MGEAKTAKKALKNIPLSPLLASGGPVGHYVAEAAVQLQQYQRACSFTQLEVDASACDGKNFIPTFSLSEMAQFDMMSVKGI